MTTKNLNTAGTFKEGKYLKRKKNNPAMPNFNSVAQL